MEFEHMDTEDLDDPEALHEAGGVWTPLTEPICRAPVHLFARANTEPGPKGRRNASYFKTAYDAFQSLYSDVESLLVTQTNLYARQKRAACVLKRWLAFLVEVRRRPYDRHVWTSPRQRPWWPLRKWELQLWLGDWLQAGWRAHAPREDRLDKDAVASNPRMFLDWMTETRFEQIDRCIHAADSAKAPKRGSADYDPVYKVRELVRKACTAWAKAYDPGAYVCVDETLLLFQGRVAFKVRIPMKRAKVGIKLYVLTGVSPSYVLGFNIKTTRHNAAEHNGLFEGTVKVMELMEQAGLLDSFRTLVADNYYTSLEELRELRKRNTYTMGVIRQSRVPPEAKFTPEEQRQPRGYSKTMVHDETGAMIGGWKDGRVVYMLSNATSSGQGKTAQRKVRGVGTIDVPCPHSFEVYNLKMWGIDGVRSRGVVCVRGQYPRLTA